MYTEVKALPHVAVAQRLLKTRGIQFQVGDTIPFIICTTNSENNGTSMDSSSYALRAYHPDEFLAKDSSLKLGNM